MCVNCRLLKKKKCLQRLLLNRCSTFYSDTQSLQGVFTMYSGAVTFHMVFFSTGCSADEDHGAHRSALSSRLEINF